MYFWGFRKTAMGNDKIIFKVIKSMTMNEKRYFKIFCKQHTLGSQNKYVLLFDLIDNLKDFDEKHIKEELKKNDYSNKYFSSDINYLMRILLKSLNEFHSEKTCDLKIKQNLISIEILFYKGLYEECLHLITKTKRIKLANESQYLMLDLLNWEKKCLGYSKGLTQAIAVNNDLANYFSVLQEAKHITDLYYKSYFFKNSVGKVALEKVQEDFEKLIDELNLTPISEQASIHTTTYFYLIYSNYFNVLKSKEQELLYLRKVIALFDENEAYKHENPLDYITVYSRIISINRRKESAVFYQDLEKLRSFDNIINLQNDVARERILLHTYQAEIEHLMHRNKLEEALVVMSKIQEAIATGKYHIEPYYMISVYYLFAAIYSTMGNYSSGLKYINTILNEYKLSERPNTFIKAEFLNIVIHYELKNYKLVLRSIANLEKKYKTNFKFSYLEKEILSTISKITENPHIVNEKVMFTKLRLEIQNKFDADESLLNSNYMKYIILKSSYRQNI